LGQRSHSFDDENIAAQRKALSPSWFVHNQVPHDSIRQLLESQEEMHAEDLPSQHEIKFCS
jgi:hypothetical protein